MHIEEKKQQELERISNLSVDEAKDIILTETRDGLTKEMAQMIRQSEEKATAEADKKKRRKLFLWLFNVSHLIQLQNKPCQWLHYQMIA